MRIFVDVDDTLVLWPTMHGSDYPINLAMVGKPNLPLVEALRSLDGVYEIIVWTTEDGRYPDVGEQPNTYARTWADLFLTPHGVPYTQAIDKNPKLLHDGDIAVDDTAVVVLGSAGSYGTFSGWLTASEFIAWAQARDGGD